MMHAIAQAICEEQPAIPSSVAPQLAWGIWTTSF